MAQWLIPQDLHSQIVHGPLCPFTEHSFGSLDGQIPRYSDSHACVRCIGALTEGRLELSINRIHRTYRRRFLEFWSFVEIGDPEECWDWQGQMYRNGFSSYFSFRRHWGRAHQYSAPRVATWLTWGDIGRLPIAHICGNHFCCNPLHIKVRGVNHFHHRRHLLTIELASSRRRLIRDTQEYLEVTREKLPSTYRKLEEVNAAWIRRRIERDGPLFAEDPDAA